jgi:pimeloyl-ACP methyl ester carboxylesterase
MNRAIVNPISALHAPGARAPMPPLWKEPLWVLDWLNLRMSPVYYGVGVPRGDGSAIVVVPGFLGSDAYLWELYLWLGRIGYRPYMSGVGVNADCPGRVTGRLVRTVERARRETGRPVRVIGHSLGGVIGRRVCLKRPDLVSQLIYLGSPLKAMKAHPAVVATATLLHTLITLISSRDGDCLTDNCRCGFLHDTGKRIDPAIRHDAIYTRTDGVVDWHDAREADPQLNHEVGGTHIGLVYNPRAYRVLGQLLADTPAARRAA